MSEYNGDAISDQEWSAAEAQYWDEEDRADDPEPQAEMKRLNRCTLHRDCRVDYDGDWCPMCVSNNLLRDYEGTVSRLRDKVRRRIEEIERCQNRIFVLDVAVANLTEQLAELTPECEEDPPIEEPRQPEDPGARNGVFPRDWGKEAGS